jgi:hypothetical protein
MMQQFPTGKRFPLAYKSQKCDLTTSKWVMSRRQHCSTINGEVVCCGSGQEGQRMKKLLFQCDSFMVGPKLPDAQSSLFPQDSPTNIVKLPDGKRVHTLDRAVFDRAVKAAMQEMQEKK